MSGDVPRTVSYYSRSLSVDAPTKEILAKHGLDDSCPPELQIRFQVYKRVAVSAVLVTPDGEESTVLSAHVALALLRDIPRLHSHDTSRLIDPEKTLAFHNDSEPREESGIGFGPGPQELNSSADEDSDDAPAVPVRVRGLPARAEIEQFRLRVANAKPTKDEIKEKAFRRWADARGRATSGFGPFARARADDSADSAPELAPVVVTPKGKRPATPKATKVQAPASLADKNLVDLLAEHDLAHFAPFLVKAGVVTVRALLKHSCDELFETLTRKHVFPHFKASSVEVKALVAIGLTAPAMMTPPKPTWEQALAPIAPTASRSFGASFGFPKPATAKPAQRVSFVPASAPPGSLPGASSSSIARGDMANAPCGRR
jgi:hypothetical protein